MHVVPPKDDSGFTLVEMLVVILVLGVLAGVVVLAVGGVSDRGVRAACKTDKTTVMTAVEAYYAKRQSYPSAIDDATSSPTTLVGGGFLESAPSTTSYTITYDATTRAVGPAACPA